jgi:hypothetical protein
MSMLREEIHVTMPLLRLDLATLNPAKVGGLLEAIYIYRKEKAGLAKEKWGWPKEGYSDGGRHQKRESILPRRPSILRTN